MKNPSLILSSAAVVISLAAGIVALTTGGSSSKESSKSASSSVAAFQDTTSVLVGKIAYLDIARLEAEYSMAVDKWAAFEKKWSKVESETQRKQNNLNKEMADLQEKAQKGTILTSVANQKYEDLMKRGEKLAKDVEKYSQEMAEERNVTSNQILDAINTFLANYNQAKGFDLILTTIGINPIISANSALDVTDEVINGLNEEYTNSQE